MIGPQPGPQTAFLQCTADIAFYGGAAGGGKTYALLLEPLRHYDNPLFGGVTFRRTTKQVRNEGGMWDEAEKLYASHPLNAEPLSGSLTFRFPSGMSLSFAHLEHEKNIYDHQGGQYGYLAFDEVTHFSAKQFFYLLSRNRSDSGVTSYVRGTCNPDAESWVAEFIEWWIEQDPTSPNYGLAIPERSGVVRWFVRKDSKITWANSREELVNEDPTCLPKSFTFIASKLEDNPILEAKDPGYRASLQALDAVERGRLLDGNWKVKAAAGMYFKADYFEVVDAVPAGGQTVRYWDRAATEGGIGPRTAGVKMKGPINGIFYILHVEKQRYSSGKVQTLIQNTATQDGRGVTVGIERDPGSAGVFEADTYVKLLAGYDVKVCPATEAKEVRAKPLSAQAEHGNVKLLRGDWNSDFTDELKGFPDLNLKDQVDAASGAFNLLTGGIAGEMKKEHVQSKRSSIGPSLRGPSQW